MYDSIFSKQCIADKLTCIHELTCEKEGEGSIADFVQQMGGTMTIEGFAVILAQFGASSVFQNEISCELPEVQNCTHDIDEQSYLPSDMADMLQCEMPEGCGGLDDCCMDLSFQLPLGVDTVTYSNMTFWYRFDFCNFTIEVSLGTFTYRTVLLDYEWGQISSFNIGVGSPSPVQIQYSVSKSSTGFTVDLTLKICFPDSDVSYCVPSTDGIPLVRNQFFPFCLKNDTDLKNFSLTAWVKERGLDINDLSGSAIQFLLEELGIAEHFTGDKCDYTRSPYMPSILGWKNECPLSVFMLPDIIDKPGRCHFLDSCSTIECCTDVPFLGLTLHTVFTIDPCGYEVNVAINSLQESRSLFVIERGKTYRLIMANGVIQLEYSLKTPANEKIYIVDMTLKICLEANSTCSVEMIIFDNTELPQMICTSMNLSGFSLTAWGNALDKVTSVATLPTDLAGLLMQQIGLDTRLIDPACERSNAVYSPSTEGWKNDCPTSVADPTGLSGDGTHASCSISSSCSAMDCCYDFTYLGRTLHCYVNIDTCNYVIRGAIEKLTFEYHFFTYNWGEVTDVRLQELIRMKFKIEQLNSQKKYLVDLEFNICLQLEPGTCGISFTVLKDHLFPQIDCDLVMDYHVTNFSLNSWMITKGLSTIEPLTTALLDDLMDVIGLGPFLNDNECDRTTGVYSSAVNGWNSNDCPATLTLSTISNTVTCHIPDYCTGVTCCVEAPLIGRSFLVSALIDGCNMKLNLGIEKRTVTCFPPKSEWVTYQRHQRSDFNPLITTHTENSKFTTPTPVPDEESIPQKEGGEYVLLERHKKSSFNALMAKSIEDIAEGRTTPPTQMSLMKNDKSPLQNGDVVVPTVKIAPAPETIVEVLPQTDGPRFNLPKILKLPEPTPIHMTWRAQTEVHEDRPSTSGLSSSSGGHEDSDAMPSSSGQHFEKIPPRPMSRNVARWAPTAVTHKSQASKPVQDDSTDDDEFGFDLETRSERPKSRYRIREAKPDENKYKGSYSNYPDSHAPML